MREVETRFDFEDSHPTRQNAKGWDPVRNDFNASRAVNVHCRSNCNIRVRRLAVTAAAANHCIGIAPADEARVTDCCGSGQRCRRGCNTSAPDGRSVRHPYYHAPTWGKWNVRWRYRNLALSAHIEKKPNMLLGARYSAVRLLQAVLDLLQSEGVGSAVLWLPGPSPYPA